MDETVRRGKDRAGLVGVRIEPDGQVSVRLSPGRRAGEGELGAAVVEAVRSATPAVPPARRRLDAETVSRAWRDLREFRSRLDDLRGASATAVSPRRRVVVTAIAGQPVDIEIDAAWRRCATDQDLADHLGYALSTVVAAGAVWWAEALAGCPDLREVMSLVPLGAGL